MNLLHKIAFKVAAFQARLIFSLIYWLLMPLFYLVGKRTLSSPETKWFSWSYRSESLDDLKNQY